MSAQPTLSAEDKKWKAQSDARTLAEAEVIKADAARHKAAQTAAAELAKDKQDEAAAMTNVANKMQLSKADGK